MISKLARVTILVQDQDEALRFYTEKLGLDKKADQKFGPGVRWLTVAPKDQKELEIVLLQPMPALHGEEFARELESRIGKGPTGVFFTDDCRQEYKILSERGVKFQTPPQDQPYGVEAVFEDLYGNTFTLLTPTQP